MKRDKDELEELEEKKIARKSPKPRAKASQIRKKTTIKSPKIKSRQKPKVKRPAKKIRQRKSSVAERKKKRRAEDR